jgi:hypothetical protein
MSGFLTPSTTRVTKILTNTSLPVPVLRHDCTQCADVRGGEAYAHHVVDLAGFPGPHRLCPGNADACHSHVNYLRSAGACDRVCGPCAYYDYGGPDAVLKPNAAVALSAPVFAFSAPANADVVIRTPG